MGLRSHIHTLSLALCLSHSLVLSRRAAKMVMAASYFSNVLWVFATFPFCVEFQRIQLANFRYFGQTKANSHTGMQKNGRERETKEGEIETPNAIHFMVYSIDCKNSEKQYALILAKNKPSARIKRSFNPAMRKM